MEALPAAPEPVRAVVGAIEALSGVVITAFFVVVVLGMLPAFALVNAWVTNQPHLDLMVRIALSAGWVIAMTLAGISLNHLTRALGSAGSFKHLLHALGNAGQPMLLSIAGQWLRIWPVLRPFVSVWWLMLALASPLTAHGIMAQIVFPHPDAGEFLFQKVMPVVLLFGASAAANTNLLIAVAALTGSESVLKFMWRFRLLIDVVVTAGVYFVRVPIGTINSLAGG